MLSPLIEKYKVNSKGYGFVNYHSGSEWYYLSMNQIELNFELMQNFIAWNRTVFDI